MQLYDAADTSGTPLIAYEKGFAAAETGTITLEAGVNYIVTASCWEGDPGGYTLVATW